MADQKIFYLLQDHRLEDYYNKFLKMGVKNEQDFLDSITDENLTEMGFSQFEKNRFTNLKDSIRRLGSASRFQVKKTMGSFKLCYKTPHCPEYKELTGMDSDQNTVEDLMMRIRHEETAGPEMGVCLFTGDGMPLTDDPFFNTWSLQDRHIENGSKLYAIFTPKENLRDYTLSQNNMKNEGPDTVRCHVMLKGDFEIRVDLEQDTFADLKGRLSLESGIPPHVLYPRDKDYRSGMKLKDLGIDEDETVHFVLSSFHGLTPSFTDIFHNDVKPTVQQTQKGLSIFYSTLMAISYRHSGDEFKKVIAYIRKLSGCNSLAQSLYQLICKTTIITRVQKVATVEGLYFLFREMLPSLTRRYGDKIIEDGDVFEHSTVCWAYLLSQGESESSEYENYAPISLKAQSTDQRLSEPVRVPGVPEVFDRANVLEKIRESEKIPNCTDENLRESSVQRATDVEKILLSLPPSIDTFPLWISYNADQPSCRMNPEKTYAQMNDELAKYPHININPPLQLKRLGVEGPCLVHLTEENVGLYLCKDKLTPQNITVFNCLSGKNENVDVDDLANKLRDKRADLTFNVTRTPKEAIAVLLDSSSSMNKECFDSQCQMTRINAVKEVFDSFSNRCMAYDFHHVISLIKFDATVKTLHAFSENMETFKEYVHGLQTTPKTRLYDALNHGIQEFTHIKLRFPDCRCRIICLTDGRDAGSKSSPVDVVKRLVASNIVVDAVIIGTGKNRVLHGISNVTGGCCFKPETTKEALQLFEMETVLSMELRKEKPKIDMSSITTERDLKNIFLTRPYDQKPEVKLPPQINEKVTMTQNVLKRQIEEQRLGRLLEKDKRILEELKSLHCDPHPYCTVLPSESDFTFWKILMQGPPETPYENGVFELYCEFGTEYPVKPPLMRFFTPIYHCNVNNVGRICHNIFDRNYSAQITMREILDAVYGLLIAPEPEDPLDSVLAEEYMASKDKYDEEARKNTESNANQTMDEAEKKYVPEIVEVVIPPHLKCPLTKKLFVDPVKTKYGFTYERKAIEKYLKRFRWDPLDTAKRLLRRTDLTKDKNTKKSVQDYRKEQIKETSV